MKETLSYPGIGSQAAVTACHSRVLPARLSSVAKRLRVHAAVKTRRRHYARGTRGRYARPRNSSRIPRGDSSRSSWGARGRACRRDQGARARVASGSRVPRRRGVSGLGPNQDSVCAAPSWWRPLNLRTVYRKSVLGTPSRPPPSSWAPNARTVLVSGEILSRPAGRCSVRGFRRSFPRASVWYTACYCRTATQMHLWTWRTA